MIIALVSTQGGHLTEMLELTNAFSDHEIFIITHHSIRDDEVRDIAATYFVDNLAEEPLHFPSIFLKAIRIIWLQKPDVILSLGADIAIPFFVIGKLLGKKTIFIESYCRSETLSRTGRITYWFADEFWVQWPQLLEKCGQKARFRGSIV